MALVPEAAAAGRAVRVAVDGPGGLARPVADGVASVVADAGRAVARVSAEDFVQGRSVRLEWGPHDVDAAYERWYDLAALRREVLDPLGDPAAMRWLPRLRTTASDRALREQRRTAVPGTVAVVDGSYLLRWEVADALDLVVHLEVSDAALRRRHPAPDPVPGAWRTYRDSVDPAARAGLVVRADHPDRPAVLLP